MKLTTSKFVREIKEGKYDDDLREIARACFDRRGRKDGTNYLAELKRLAPGTLTTVREAVSPMDVSALWSSEFDEPVYYGKLEPASPERWPAANRVLINGVPYFEHEIIGRIFMSTGDHPEFPGLWYRVLSVGKTSLRVQILEVPIRTRPASKMGKAARTKAAIYVPFSIMSEVLNDGR